MTYSFDTFGWFSPEMIPGRATDVPPQETNVEKTIGALYPNFTGYEWLMIPYHETELTAPKNIRLSKLEFLNRFTDQELEGIYIAAETSIPVKIWFDKFKLAEYIDLADSLTIAGLSKLEQSGLIAIGRSNEILR